MSGVFRVTQTNHQQCADIAYTNFSKKVEALNQISECIELNEIVPNVLIEWKPTEL